MKTRARVLLYSHDSFGLGHIRRCRAIAHALAERFQGLDALILSGSPIIGSFDFKARVDFIRVPGIIKLRSGDYEPLDRHRSIVETTRMRAALIGDAALQFAPHVLIVDKEPLGLRGELSGILERLKERGTTLILGLRDVLDDPEALRMEWERKKVYPAIEALYDEIWVFGLKRIYDPLTGLPLSHEVQRKTRYTGYIGRPMPQIGDRPQILEGLTDYLYASPGGGGDGDQMAETVLNAYAASPGLPSLLLVLGPFMAQEKRGQFEGRARALHNVRMLTFDARAERLMAGASGVIAMGGYNTFCEILSFDKPALLMPRRRPRLEQTIRAERAQTLGLAALMALPDDGPAPVGDVIRAIGRLRSQPPPSEARISGLLDGTQCIAERIKPYLPGA